MEGLLSMGPTPSSFLVQRQLLNLAFATWILCKDKETSVQAMALAKVSHCWPNLRIVMILKVEFSTTGFVQLNSQQ